jgi:hypothetical protein
MNPVEIEEAISALAEQPFDAQEFPFAFLQAFGNKETPPSCPYLRNDFPMSGVLGSANHNFDLPPDMSKTEGFVSEQLFPFSREIVAL